MYFGDFYIQLWMEMADFPPKKEHVTLNEVKGLQRFWLKSAGILRSRWSLTPSRSGTCADRRYGVSLRENDMLIIDRTAPGRASHTGCPLRSSCRYYAGGS